MKYDNCKIDLPYPEPFARKKDGFYADRLSMMLAGRGGEMSAVVTYMYQHTVFKQKYGRIADIIECIGIVEMRHYGLLCSLIFSLGSDPVLAETDRRREYYWNGSYANYKTDPENAVLEDIKEEKRAIENYRGFLSDCKDKSVNEVIERIILDEEHHIVLLSDIYRELSGKSAAD